MKVALVHEFLTKLGGAERVVKEFADMFPQAPIFTLFYDEANVGSVFPKERVRTSKLQKYYKILKAPQPLLPYMSKAIESFDFSGYDLVLSSSSGFAHGIITPVDTIHICYCHSPMRYAWDYTHEYRKEKGSGIFGKLKNMLISKTLHKIREWDFIASDRPDYYIANSKTVQNRIKKYYKLESDIIYPPVNTKQFKISPNSDNYFLIISTLTPYKKIDLAIQVFNELKKTLIIIGDGHDKARLQKLAKPNIHFLGRKSDKEIKEHLANTTAFIFPGEDDFGMAPVEAMASGKPIIAYKKGGATETVIDGQCGVFFEKPEAEALKNAVMKFLDKKREGKFDANRIAKHAKQFSREVFITKIKDFITEKCKEK